MAQADIIKKLQENPQQAKQFNEVAEILNKAVEKEMPTFIKLVQFDVLSEIQKKAVSNNVPNNNAAEKQLTEDLDKVFAQINNDLKDQIVKKFEELKK